MIIIIELALFTLSITNAATRLDEAIAESSTRLHKLFIKILYSKTSSLDNYMRPRLKNQPPTALRMNPLLLHQRLANFEVRLLRGCRKSRAVQMRAVSGRVQAGSILFIA
jgi:hypothetical protein